jgi:hypothetical protein
MNLLSTPTNGANSLVPPGTAKTRMPSRFRREVEIAVARARYSRVGGGWCQSYSQGKTYEGELEAPPIWVSDHYACTVL